MMIPRNVSFETWANSLLIDFPTDNIPIHRKGGDWRKFGDLVAELPTFSENGAPSAKQYSDPMIWAMAVYKQMTNVA